MTSALPGGSGLYDLTTARTARRIFLNILVRGLFWAGSGFPSLVCTANDQFIPRLGCTEAHRRSTMPVPHTQFDDAAKDRASVATRVIKANRSTAFTTTIITIVAVVASAAAAMCVIITRPTHVAHENGSHDAQLIATDGNVVQTATGNLAAARTLLDQPHPPLTLCA